MPSFLNFMCPVLQASSRLIFYVSLLSYQNSYNNWQISYLYLKTMINSAKYKALAMPDVFKRNKQDKLYLETFKFHTAF